MRYPLRERVFAWRLVERKRCSYWLSASSLGAAVWLASAAAGHSAAVPLAQSPPGDALALLHRVQTHAQPILNVSKVILAEPAGETPLPIQVGPPDAIARNSFIRIRGLPPAAALTEGHSIAPGAWAIPIIALPNLKIALPVGLSGKSEATVALVTVDGTVIAETKVALVVASTAMIAPGDAAPQSKNVASLGRSDSATSPSSDAAPRREISPPPLTEEQKRAQTFLTRGDEMLAQGNIAAARLFFRRAAEAGLAQGAFALAATFDPVELRRVGALTVRPDQAEARKWYERARDLGLAEAGDRLQRLGVR